MELQDMINEVDADGEFTSGSLSLLLSVMMKEERGVGGGYDRRS